MSGNLKLKGATSGSSQLLAPDTGTDQQFTFPATGGELAVVGSPKVFFWAETSAGLVIDTGNDPIIWNVEEHDVGNNYDPSTGIFTAPQNGFYQFNGQFFAGQGGNNLAGAIDLFVGGQRVSRFGREFTVPGYEGYAIVWSGYVAAGAQAWIQRWTGSVHVAPENSFFSGYLIS